MLLKKIVSLLLLSFICIQSTSIVTSNETQTITETITFSYSSPIIKQNDEGNICEILQIETNAQVVKQDYYIIPKDVHQFTFPKGTSITDITVTPKNIATRTIHLEPEITPPPQVLTLDVTEHSDYHIQDPNHIDTWYDHTIGTGIIDGTQCVILTVELYPALYLPVQKELHSVDTFEINITYQKPEILSADENTDTYDLLIIAPMEYSTALQPLLSHKISINIPTLMVTLEDIYNGYYTPVQGRDEQEQIKYFIKHAIETWEISNVLLVGSAEKLPPRETHVNVGNFDKEIFVSDLYYADIYNRTDAFSSWDTNQNQIYGEYEWDGNTDEVDLYPDVHLGRLACVSESEVTIVVDKIITYETHQPYTEDWFSNIVTIGGDSFPHDDDEISEGEFVNAYIIDMMDGFIPSKIWASNGLLGSVSPTGLEIILDEINKGAGFVDFSGHGNTHKFATHPFNKDNIWLPTPYSGFKNTHAHDLENDEKLPIIVTGACSVAKFNKDDDCFSWSFLTNPNGGGIGSFGATGLGYAYSGKYVTYGLIEKMASDVFKAYKTNYVHTLGELWTWGIYRNMKSRMDSTEYKTIEEWQLFGDPTLRIAGDSNPPAKPTISGPSSCKKGKEYSYEASSTDSDSTDLYYCFDWGDGSYSDWIGPIESGTVVSATHQWDETGEYEIRVSSKDDQGVHSSWSDPLPISISKNPFWRIERIIQFLFNENIFSPLFQKDTQFLHRNSCLSYHNF